MYYAVRDAPASLREWHFRFRSGLSFDPSVSFASEIFWEFRLFDYDCKDIASYCCIINSATSLDSHTYLYALIIPRVSRPPSCSEFSVTSCMKNFTCYFKTHTNWRSDLCRINRTQNSIRTLRRYFTTMKFAARTTLRESFCDM